MSPNAGVFGDHRERSALNAKIDVASMAPAVRPWLAAPYCQRCREDVAVDHDLELLGGIIDHIDRMFRSL